MKYFSKLTVSLTLVLLLKSVVGASLDDSKRVLSSITSGYDKDFRPVRNQSRTITLNVTFDLVTIQNFDEVEEKISITGVVNLAWFDTLLKWNPDDFGGITSLTIPTTYLWVPELLHQNPADEVKRLVEDWHLVVLHYDGAVEYSPGGVFTSTCSIDVTYYPFDKQFCEILFGVWGYSKSEVRIKSPRTDIMKTFYKTDGAWFLKNTRARLKSVGTYSDSILSFEVILEREPRFVVVNVIVPIIFMEILNPLVFLMTNESGERISYCIAVLLTIAVFLTLVGDNIPKTSNPLSIYSYFLLSILIISVVIAVATIYSLRLYYRSDRNKIGSFWRTIVNTFGCKGKTSHDRDLKSKSSTMSDGEPYVPYKLPYYSQDHLQQRRRYQNSFEDEDRKPAARAPRRRQRYRDIYSNDITWMDVSKTIDRFFLIFFIVVCIINTVAFLTIMATGQSDDSPN